MKRAGGYPGPQVRGGHREVQFLMRTHVLDVGAHVGQTVGRLLSYRSVARISAFEPSAKSYSCLVGAFGNDSRVTAYPFGLWNRNCTAVLHNDGSTGASVWPDYRPCRKTPHETVCEFRRASEWVRDNVGSERTVLKMNCEGCEADILDDLLDSGMYDRFAFVLIDWDVRKSPSQAHRRAEVEARLAGKTNWVKYHGPSRLEILHRLLWDGQNEA